MVKRSKNIVISDNNENTRRMFEVINNTVGEEYTRMETVRLQNRVIFNSVRASSIKFMRKLSEDLSIFIQHVIIDKDPNTITIYEYRKGEFTLERILDEKHDFEEYMEVLIECENKMFEVCDRCHGGIESRDVRPQNYKFFTNKEKEELGMTMHNNAYLCPMCIEELEQMELLCD